MGIKKIDKNNIKRGNVIISQNASKLCVKTFTAKITVLKAQSTTIRVGYEPILHCYAIRQVIKILNIIDKKNSRNILDLVFLHKINKGEIKLAINDVVAQPSVYYQKTKGSASHLE